MQKLLWDLCHGQFRFWTVAIDLKSLMDLMASAGEHAPHLR